MLRSPNDVKRKIKMTLNNTYLTTQKLSNNSFHGTKKYPFYFNGLRFISINILCFYRIDGTLVNITAHIGKKMKLNNGTAVMDIQKTFSSELDESGIVLISLQFESGLLFKSFNRAFALFGQNSAEYFANYLSVLLHKLLLGDVRRETGTK